MDKIKYVPVHRHASLNGLGFKIISLANEGYPIL